MHKECVIVSLQLKGQAVVSGDAALQEGMMCASARGQR